MCHDCAGAGVCGAAGPQNWHHQTYHHTHTWLLKTDSLGTVWMSDAIPTKSGGVMLDLHLSRRCGRAGIAFITVSQTCMGLPSTAGRSSKSYS